MSQIGPVERAFQIAGAGGCRDVEDLIRKLKQEGYMNAPSHLGGQSVRRQLRERLQSAVPA